MPQECPTCGKKGYEPKFHPDNHRFWTNWMDHPDIKDESNLMIHHDLTYYGIEIPAEYCEEYAR